MTLLFAFLLPIYLAVSFYFHPHVTEPLLTLAWLSLISWGFLLSLAWSHEQPPQIICPACNTPNPPHHLLCHECFSDLYRLDETGNLVPISSRKVDP